MFWPYPRILVLHVTVILGLLLVNIPATTSPDAKGGGSCCSWRR